MDSNDFVLCADCRGMIKHKTGNIWGKPFEGYTEGPMTSHGYCPECFDKAKNEIEGYFDETHSN